MKRIIRIIVCMYMFFMFITPSFALANSIPEERLLPRLVDDAHLLSEYEYQSLLAKLDEISERQQFDIAIVTTGSLGGYDSDEYADDFYDYNGYGMGGNDSGILLLISMEERDWAISTHGFGITVFTDAGQEYLVNQFIGDLSDGNYADAFNKFADISESFIIQAKSEKPYDNSNIPKSPPPPYLPVITTTIGIVIAFIITGIMRMQLKSVSMQTAAGSYIKNNSLKIAESKDVFLYANLSKTKIQKAQSSSSSGSSTHRSSSGRSHGGSKGKF